MFYALLTFKIYCNFILRLLSNLNGFCTIFMTRFVVVTNNHFAVICWFKTLVYSSPEISLIWCVKETYLTLFKPTIAFNIDL